MLTADSAKYILARGPQYCSRVLGANFERFIFYFFILTYHCISGHCMRDKRNNKITFEHQAFFFEACIYGHEIIIQVHNFRNNV